jgi:hypothetical protein
MVLDLAARTAEFHAVDYDVAACRRALVERGLPAGSNHFRPSPWRTAARSAKRGVRRALRAGRVAGR